MKDWYRLSDEQYANLMKRLTTLDLVKSVPLFYAQEAPVSKLNVMRYLDDHGSDANEVHYFIWKAVFNSMDDSDKVDIMRYLEWLEEGDEDDEDAA